MAVRLVEWHGKYLTEVFKLFKDRLRKNWTTGFQALIKYGPVFSAGLYDVPRHHPHVSCTLLSGATSTNA